MKEHERQAAMRTVYDWIAEAHGQHAAEFWAWERTPYPVGLPDDEQLDEGLWIAASPTMTSGIVVDHA